MIKGTIILKGFTYYNHYLKRICTHGIDTYPDIHSRLPQTPKMAHSEMLKSMSVILLELEEEEV